MKKTIFLAIIALALVSCSRINDTEATNNEATKLQPQAKSGDSITASRDADEEVFEHDPKDQTIPPRR